MTIAPTRLLLAFEGGRDEDDRAFVLAHFDFFYQRYLAMWTLDTADRPRDRTAEIFREWFEMRINRMVEDVMDEPLMLE